jgi:hypothetical protein
MVRHLDPPCISSFTLFFTFQSSLSFHKISRARFPETLPVSHLVLQCNPRPVRLVSRLALTEGTLPQVGMGSLQEDSKTSQDLLGRGYE